MRYHIRTICSLLLSLALVVMPLQSYGVMMDMGDNQSIQASTDTGCKHSDITIADNSSNCCFDQCEQDCDAGCSHHAGTAALIADHLTSLDEPTNDFARYLPRHHSLAPSPPLPPPLI